MRIQIFFISVGLIFGNQTAGFPNTISNIAEFGEISALEVFSVHG